MSLSTLASSIVIDTIDRVEVPIIGLQDLKANKMASGRFKDLADLENL